MKWLLNDNWTLVVDSDARPVPVPGCWEATGVAKELPGPFVYERQLVMPRGIENKRWWLRFEGVSYHALIYVDDRVVGEHTGTWDAFELDVTRALTPERPSVLRVVVEKPASLVKGPASASVEGQFPLKETLAGFLPYVWGYLFGGLWQDVWLEARETVAVEEAFIRTDATGSFTAEVTLSAAALCTLELFSPSGERTASVCGEGHKLSLTGRVEGVHLWHQEEPSLYQARLTIGKTVVKTWRVGFRSFESKGTTLYLNGQAIYPRMALSWGWYLSALHSNPGRDEVRADLLRLKELGYNGVKLCLWVPPAYYFELADELGMLLWLELPMWLPKVTPFFLKQTPREYERIVRQVRQHPSLIIYSLGCELSREVDADVLEPLYHQTKALVGEALLRDNSGSGEAYGGLLNEFADYYDYHFYSDIQFFAELVDYFSPRWRPVQPWIFGEFCDFDTFRALDRLAEASGAPWWISDDPRRNPQGARWQFDVPLQQARLEANGLAARSAELEHTSKQQALLHRKFTLELVRTYREISGYVVTGERDTPISTAGMWNDLGEDKFPPESFKAFNDDLVLALGWDKRRAWLRGGDRAAYWDTFSYPGGALVRAHLIASNFSQAHGQGTLEWSAKEKNRQAVAEGRAVVKLGQGELREIALAEFALPQVESPSTLTIKAELHLGTVQTRNSWPLWCFPDPWRGLGPVALYDPEDRFASLRTLLTVDAAAPVLLSTSWTRDVEAYVRGGGRAVLLAAVGPLPQNASLQPMPFWREAVKLIEPHPAWGDFPHEGWADLQFFGMATDLAIDTARVPGCKPILRRVDARTMAVHDYAAEVTLGAGTLVMSTLRFGGGLGRQPVDITRNTAAAYLLSRWLRYLQAS